MSETPSGFHVVVDRASGHVSRSWRPELSAAMMYARTLQRATGPGDRVWVEDARTRERRWPSEER